MGNLATNPNLKFFCNCFYDPKISEKEIKLCNLNEKISFQKIISSIVRIQSYFRKFLYRKSFYRILLGKTTAKSFEEEFFLSLIKSNDQSSKYIGNTEMSGFLKNKSVKRVKKSTKNSFIYDFISEDLFPNQDDIIKQTSNIYGKSFYDNYRHLNPKIIDNIKNSNIVMNLNIEKNLKINNNSSNNNNFMNYNTEHNSFFTGNAGNSFLNTNINNYLNNSGSNLNLSNLGSNSNNNNNNNSSSHEPHIKKVTIKYSEGSYYKGEFNSSSSKKEGFGVFIFKDKSVYEGSFLNNQMEGYGRLITLAGDYYEGGFKNSKFQGEGLLINTLQGIKYTGEFLEGLKHGEGEEYYKANTDIHDLNYSCCMYQDTTNNNPSYNSLNVNHFSKPADIQGEKPYTKGYKGNENKDNKENGIYMNNSYTNCNNSNNEYHYYYKGSFKNNRRNGIGKLIKKNKFFYNGNFYMDQMEGKGIGKWMDGRVFNGEWKNNKMHGNGVFFWPDGDIYIGQYTNDRKHGVGVFIWKDKKKYEGYWMNGQQHGFGMFHTGDTIIFGEWKKGEIIKDSERYVDLKNLSSDGKILEIKNIWKEIKNHFGKFDHEYDTKFFEISN